MNTCTQVNQFNSSTSWSILTVHVPLMFILNKRIAPGFTILRVVRHNDLLDRTMHLELTAQLGLRSVVVLEGKRTEGVRKGCQLKHVTVTYNSGDKECPEGVLRRMLDLMRIPEGNLSLQVVCHLFGLFTASTFQALLPGLDPSGWRCVLGVLEKVQEASDAQVAWKGR